MADSEPTTPTAADEARAKAEARRQRILEKSSQRMGLVSGEQVKQEPKDEGEVAAAAVESSNASSRMQAMRRRRLKKQQQAKEEGAAAAETTETTKVEPAAVVVVVETATEETPAPEPVTTPKAAPAPASTTTDESSTRKYKGVAAMRRQRLKEKAAKEDAATQAAGKSAVATKLPERKKLAVEKIPVIMHLLTVLVLFLGGLKVGTDQVAQEHVTVHREFLAPQQHGIGVLRLVDRFTTAGASPEPKALLEQEQAGSVDPVTGMKDEFGGDDDEDEEYVPNIDPLFQLDLDSFTKGNSLFMIVARFAVGLHRLNLYFFYYLPIGIFNAVMRLPAKLVQTPPLLFAFCLFVRQFAKRVLGAALPDVPSDNKKEDLLAMAKTWVMNFLSSSFPTVVEFYDAFTHLRSDMFILLCGFFVGLVWNHHSVAVVGAGHDEL